MGNTEKKSNYIFWNVISVYLKNPKYDLNSFGSNISFGKMSKYNSLAYI